MPKVFTVPLFTDRRPIFEEAEEYYSQRVGKGWHKILLDLTDKLFYLGWDGGIEQVKEKFGELRFYWRNNIEDSVMAKIAEDIVHLAEYRSASACEVCGAFGEKHSDGWIHTMCAPCWDTHVKDREEEKRKYAENAISHPVD